MRACITINDVLRRHWETFREVYEIYLDEENQLEEFHENPDFEFGELQEDETVKEVSFSKVERKILDLDGISDPCGLTSEFAFENPEEFYNFLYQSMSFEVFAKTNVAYKNAIEDFNNLVNFFESNGIELDIVSMEKGNSKPATLFFLSREKCKPKNIRFVDSYIKIWDEYQIVITADKYLILNKRPRRKLFKIETPQNKDLNFGLSCQTLKDVLNKFKK